MKKNVTHHPLLLLFLILASTLPSQSMYSVAPLTKEKASKSGITVQSRPNGDDGTKVWLEIRKDCSLGDFNFIELRMKDDNGQHLLSTRLQPHPVTQGQSGDTITASFSVSPSQLKNCSFWLYKGGGVFDGVILTIKVSDFLKN